MPIGAYPNLLHIPAGWTLDNEVPTGHNEEMDIPTYVSFAQDYIAAGATLIGGCCGIGPEYIQALNDHLARPNSNRVNRVNSVGGG